MVTESFAGHPAFGVTDVTFAMGRRRLRRGTPAHVTINKNNHLNGSLRLNRRAAEAAEI